MERFNVLRVIALGLIAALLPCTGNGQQNLSAGDIYKKATPALVFISTFDAAGKPRGDGSGFLVAPDGKILTNYHVIAHSKSATVKLANGDAYDRVDVIDIDKRKDIALLKIRAVELPALALGRLDQVQVGDKVYSLSNPLGDEDLKGTFSEGIVSGIRQGDGFRFLQLTAPISPGSSGSPVFNRDGLVIGIAKGSLPGGQNLNFAIPIDYAKGMLPLTDLRTLESVYEPPPAQEPAPSAPSAAPDAPTASATLAPAPSEEFKKASLVYLEGKLYKWTLEDARKELGEPSRTRPSFTNGQATGTIYAFPDPTRSALEFELTFTSATKLMTMVIAYPLSVQLDAMKRMFGTDYLTQKQPNGEKMLAYRSRRVILRVDGKDRVISIGVY